MIHFFVPCAKVFHISVALSRIAPWLLDLAWLICICNFFSCQYKAVQWLLLAFNLAWTRLIPCTNCTWAWFNRNGECVSVCVFLCHSLDQYQLNAHIIFIARPLFKEPVKQGQLWTEAKFKTWRLRNFCSQRLLSLSPCLISFALFIMYNKKNGKHSSESREKTLSFTLLNFGSLRGTTLKPKPEEINIQKSKFAANFRERESGRKSGKKTPRVRRVGQRKWT